ncbi:ATP-binding cassette subfamily B protein AbcA/BmrA [Polymorphobacter multimanifer]|uniref:ATP-binding cassette subfamily B protein AbcA/BmrA n=1 Tax=Polymorphobacter multimanifer TaxID=1070431 RepID=A0A841LBI7_9SPHN|nr:ABC transporter ATP-binding protein [Polymorphobacter multimanifer]MBB6229041.1 ATP-binding cassette subfamily B protein AbcA/BmrA [Polymorphobacter multimanifer]
MSEKTQSARPGTGALRKVIAAGQPRRLAIACAIGIGLVEVASTLAFPVITRDIIDAVTRSTPGVGSLLADPRVVLLVVILLAGAVCGAVSSYLLSRAALRVTRNVQQSLFDSMVGRSMRFFDANESGALVSRMVSDTKSVSQLLTTGAAGLVNAVVLLAGSVVVLLLLDTALTLVIFGIVLGTFALMIPMVMRLAAISKAINAASARVSSAVARVFGGIRLVKAATAEATERTRLAGELAAVETEARKLAMVQSLLNPVNGLAVTAALVVLFTYGSARIQLGTLSAGTLTAFILYIFNIVAPLIAISTFIAQFRIAQGSAGVLADLLVAEMPTTVRAERATVPIAEARGDIVFDGIGFDYGDGGEAQPTLAIGRMVIPAGKRTAIVGASGSGKSTLLALIERFYAPQRGQITCGGHDIADFDLAEWRGTIGYVAQSAVLLSGTIADNIGYGAGEPDRARVLAAAEAANAREFIDRLPGGIDAPVGEQGGLLSGGQRQRIAIAQVFYRDPRILLLDEATASLDLDNGRLVMAAFERLMEGRTTIIVTHQPELLRNIDRVFTISRGALVDDDGTQAITAMAS